VQVLLTMILMINLYLLKHPRLSPILYHPILAPDEPFYPFDAQKQVALLLKERRLDLMDVKPLNVNF
jgi:hypothetical protein